MSKQVKIQRFLFKHSKPNSLNFLFLIKIDLSMVVFDYTHAFTLQQLQLILTQYLSLGPYYECLKKSLQNYIHLFNSLPINQRHHQDKQHPVKLPVNCYNYKSKRSGKVDQDDYQGQITFIYPLTSIIEVLKSNKFYLELPKNIIINGLLTTTNINIIIQTLTIVSEGLSKLIPTTLFSIQQKMLANYINTLVNDCLEGQEAENIKTTLNKRKIQFNDSQRKISLKDLGFLGLLFQKGLNMVAEQQNKQKYLTTESDIGIIKIDSVMEMSNTQSNQNVESFNNLLINKCKKTKQKNLKRKQSRASILASIISVSDLNDQDTKYVVKTLKSLMGSQKILKPVNLIDMKDEDQFDKKKHDLQSQFVKKPKVFVQCEYCRNYRNYLLESTGLSYFDQQQISKIPTEIFSILKRIKSVINVFTLYLKQTNQTTIAANINTINKIICNINLTLTETIWQDPKLNPKMTDKNSSLKRQNNQGKSFKAQSLLIQLQPYYKQIYNYQAHSQSQFSIDQLLRMCLKAPQIKDIEKQLVERYMNQTRIKKQGKSIQTFCITKQKLNDKINVPLNAQKQILFDAQKNIFISKTQPFVNQIELLRQYQKEQGIINNAKIHSRPIFTQINQKYQQEINLNSAISRHKSVITNKHPNMSMEISQNNLTDNKKVNEAHQNERFKMIMYQQYMRNQGFNVTKNNMSVIINQNINKMGRNGNFNSKQNDAIHQVDGLSPTDTNGQFSNFGLVQGNTNNTLSTVYVKTEDQYDTNFDKKETEIYNKMLLNGQTIRNEVVNQAEYGQAIIYQSYQDFLKKLEEMNVSSQADSQIEEQANQILFFTTACTSNFRKTTSGKNGGSKHDQSLMNSRKCETSKITKTQNPKLLKKTSIISIDDSKYPIDKSSNFKRTLFKDSSNVSRQNLSRKQIKFKNQQIQNQQKDRLINCKRNQNLELKKPVWLDQFLDKANDNYIQPKPKTQVGKTLLQNQRFLAFQQKCMLMENLQADKNKNSAKILKNQFNSSLSQIDKDLNNQNENKGLKVGVNLKRPFSAVSSGQNRGGTIKSLSRTLNGKKRSFLLSRQFVIQNNSLLTKMYKQNEAQNLFNNAKRQLQRQKSLKQFNSKIQKSKFRTDKYVY